MSTNVYLPTRKLVWPERNCRICHDVNSPRCTRWCDNKETLAAALVSGKRLSCSSVSSRLLRRAARKVSVVASLKESALGRVREYASSQTMVPRLLETTVPRYWDFHLVK